MATGYIVNAPLVVIPDKGGHDRYLYKDSPVPEDVNTEHRALLVKQGMIVKGKVAATAADSASSGGGGSSTEVPEDFDPDDPGKHSVKVVQAFLAQAGEEDRDRVIDAEADRDNPRKGIVEWEPPATNGDDGADAV